jgi:hypothetical protein
MLPICKRDNRTLDSARGLFMPQNPAYPGPVAVPMHRMRLRRTICALPSLHRLLGFYARYFRFVLGELKCETSANMCMWEYINALLIMSHTYTLVFSEAELSQGPKEHRPLVATSLSKTCGSDLTAFRTRPINCNIRTMYM